MVNALFLFFSVNCAWWWQWYVELLKVSDIAKQMSGVHLVISHDISTLIYATKQKEKQNQNESNSLGPIYTRPPIIQEHFFLFLFFMIVWFSHRQPLLLFLLWSHISMPEACIFWEIVYIFLFSFPLFVTRKPKFLIYFVGWGDDDDDDVASHWQNPTTPLTLATSKKSWSCTSKWKKVTLDVYVDPTWYPNEIMIRTLKTNPRK